MLFQLPDFEPIDATDMNEAVACPWEYGGRANVIAGGTDLLSLMKDRLTGQLLSDAEATGRIGARPLPMNAYEVDLTKALIRNVLGSITETANRSAKLFLHNGESL